MCRRYSALEGLTERFSRGPKSFGGSPRGFVLYVQDVDGVVKRAVAAGATLERPIKNEFYGDRTGGLTDPFGHVWYVMTHIEDVSNEEMEKRAAALSEIGTDVTRFC